jgi:Dolichyl-phosphate-mannose-protein mannosyltransferase
VESDLIALKPSADPPPGLTIDQVLEKARVHAIMRDIDVSRHRPLPNLVQSEPLFVRLLWLLVAAVLLWGHFYLVKSFWAPSHPGVDQNGYQVGGKLFSETFSSGYKPSNPYIYVGWMWIQTPDGWVYPKYPLGIPVLDALCLWLAPTLHQGVVWSYMVSPVCTVLAAAAMFLMLRTVASSFAAVLGLILMAANPVALVLSNNSNSHAAAMGFTTWGILFLIWWMRYGSWWRGLIAGFLLGYAVTIRYTEGLLILPIAAAVLTSMRYERPREIRWWAAGIWIALAIIGGVLKTSTHVPMQGWHTWAPLALVALLFSLAPSRTFSPTHAWGYLLEASRSLISAAIVFTAISLNLSTLTWKSPVDQSIVTWLAIVLLLGLIPLIYSIRWLEPKSYLRPLIVPLGWLIPVIALVIFNKFAMGSWTGYDTTNESEGFSWNYFIDKWDFMVGQLYNTGLFFIAPLGIAGMFVMYRASARVAAVMTLWFVPGLLLYAAYYWGLNSNGVGYLRFFLTLFPPMIFCAAWLLDYLRRGSIHFTIRRGAIAAPIAAAVIVAIATSMDVYGSRGALERDFTIQTNLADTGDRILAKTKDSAESNPARRPILFGDARQLLNYIQFAGNFECYSIESFTDRGFRRRIADPDAPNPLQKARIDSLQKLYEGKSDADLWREATNIINKALADKRHVYIALPAAIMPNFRGRFARNDYDVTTLDRWREPVTMSADGQKALMGMGAAGMMMGGRATPQNWELAEVTKKPPAPTPAPKPPQPKAPQQKSPPPKPVAKPTTAPTTRPQPLFEIK